ncbi:uncharacterized protein KD926_011094 [Aspergillus affinis]|uniref:uncharacterized protein n=1 Tax=Aspergillus affinis TaxID=1070780 RepID=UPI0022FE2A08|nr:uncharacterized protein KD926_011094 [Aspergillus affinis]KAI9044921.1 hypothetical protein KD926_011094 [Aspergillus affinis]
MGRPSAAQPEAPGQRASLLVSVWTGRVRSPSAVGKQGEQAPPSPLIPSLTQATAVGSPVGVALTGMEQPEKGNMPSVIIDPPAYRFGHVMPPRPMSEDQTIVKVPSFAGVGLTLIRFEPTSLFGGSLGTRDKQLPDHLADFLVQTGRVPTSRRPGPDGMPR